MQLNQTYNREDFLHFLEQSFLSSFKRDIRPINKGKVSTIQKAYSLGRDEKLDLQVFEFHSSGELNNRVALTRDAFNIMKASATFNGLAIFYSSNKNDWRLSLMTANPERTEAGKITMAYSNPKRYSYFLGPNAKVNTPTKFLIKKEKIIDFNDLKGRFSTEVVNKEFYKQISESFTKLVGGTISKSKITYKPLLKLPFIQDKNQTCLEFAVRIIGRIIFCWFLREKTSQSGKSLMPKGLLSLEAVNKNEDYYHKILEPIFFEILNKPIKSRKDRYITEPFSSIPYLNGGLFSPQNNDYFSYKEDQAINHNIVIVPNQWFKDLFEILETYNFTIDENISFDEDLSIDPEMLGRIFENLLAEINPETGESARKSTGSFYTPRPIVDYMVNESVFLYLQTKTGIEEVKLRAAISYNLDDDLQYPLSDGEKEKVIDALEEVKILDPACGSGAFPIGALQKIVFILQQLDPEGQLWFQKQIKSTSPEIKRVLEREFENKNFDYIRKLGVIRENIYGVDIQPIATEISRLRCFLTLIVDETIHDELENRGIEPLPNLDFKFVTANSLIGLPESSKEDQMGLFEDDRGIKELKNLRDMFFTASGSEREQLKLHFVQAQNRMFQRLIRDGRAGHADLTTKLTTWDPFSHEPSIWFDPEWMFGITNGFNIVIGNPPYVGLDKLDKTFVNQLKRSYPEIHTGYNDLLYYFIYKGIEILNEKGVFCMIVANYFIGNTYAKLLRNYLKEKVCKIINFQNYQVFDQANVHTSIVVAKNEQKSIPICFYSLNSEEELKDIESISPIVQDRSELKGNWIVASLEQKEVIKKIHQKIDLLGDISIIEQGSKSGKNSIFTLDKNIAKTECLEMEILRKNIKNSDIKRYFIHHAEKLLIYTDNQTVIDKYPNIKRYLHCYENQLSNRNEVKKGLYDWFRFDRPRRREIFDSKEKLIVPYRAKHNCFAYDDQQFFNDGGDIRAIVLKDEHKEKYNLKYILALLNSSLLDWYYGFIGKPKGNMREYFNKPMADIPIKKLPIENQQPFINLVDQILEITKLDDYLGNPTKQDKVRDLECQIDELVYKLYGLSEEEKNIVQNYA